MNEFPRHVFEPLREYTRMCGYVWSWERCMKRENDPIHL